MIATPEQYRTLADLIERADVTAICIVGKNMLVASNVPGDLWAIRPDGTITRPKFLDAETMR